MYPVLAALIAATEVLYFLGSTRSDMIQFMVTLPYASFATQGIHTLALTLMNPASFSSLHAKSYEIFKVLNENHGNRSILARPLRIGTVIQSLMTTLYVVILVFILFLPLATWWITGQKILILLFRLPGVDERCTEGFLETMALHVALLPIAFCGFLGIDCLFLALIVPVVAFVDAMANEMDELNQLLQSPESSQGHEIRSKLIRLVQLHQLLIKYELTLEEHYNVVVFVKIGAIVFGMISTILVMFNVRDIMAFIFTIVLFEQLTQYCLLGAVISSKNNQLIDHLYDIKWYLLPAGQAKHLVLMLERAQNAPTLTVGKFATLNMELYDNIMKKVYSYVMLLATFLEQS
ncbi:hypothetical protein pipiens_006985 [Culex pipiens pipiens]|uniref:Odorant receptor n=1 Tax=Culex pipiens pipiens TaxID=38569 RepID=A0ABD1DMK6_CULPP